MQTIASGKIFQPSFRYSSVTGKITEGGNTMRTQIKLLAIVSATLAAAMVSNAQRQRPGREEGGRQPAIGATCPTCGNPSAPRQIRQIQHRRQQMSAESGQPARRHMNAPRQGRQQPPVNQRFQRNRQQAPAAYGRERRTPDQQQMNPQAARQQQVQRVRQQIKERFDFDGDGQLSDAEKAAAKAFRQELRKNRGDRPGRSAPVQE
jgi:hypothetical protein